MDSKVTNQQIVAFRDTGTLWLRHHKNAQTGRTKLDYAIEKMVGKLKSAHEKYIDEQGDARDELAAIDEKTKVILKEPNGETSQYTVENSKALRKRLRDLASKEVEVQPHYIDEANLPSLTFEYPGMDGRMYPMNEYDIRKAFEGIVIKPLEEPA